MVTFKGPNGEYYAGDSTGQVDEELMEQILGPTRRERNTPDSTETIPTGAADERTGQSLDNATNSETTRSDANTPPTGEAEKPPSKESVKKYKASRKKTNANIKKQTPEEKKKAQLQKLREQADANLTKTRERKKQIKAYEKRQTARDEKIAGLGRKGNITGLGLLGALVDGAFTYGDERSKDPSGSKVLDLAKAGAVAGAWLVAEPVMWGLTIAGMAKSGLGMLKDDAQENYDISKNIALHVNKDESGSNKGTLGGKMVDNEYAATSRQRQEQIMRNHKISTESILGSEARQLHR